MRIPFLFSVVLLCGALAAQVPQAFNYQAVARNASGDALAGQAIGVRLTLHSGTANGPVAYQEVHNTSTNALGLFTLSVGQGSAVQGSFAGVPWGSAAHFLQVELDATGGTSYTDIGTSQMLSVPYALHASSVACPTVSLLGDTVRYGNGCYLIQPGMSAANGGCLDLDSDGFYDRPGCGEVDCDDAVASTNPGAVELCGNGVDDDCDGTPDNNSEPQAFVTFYADADGDGYGDPAISNTACAQPMGYVANDADCDDTDVSVFPGNGCSTVCTPAEVAWVDANFIFYKESLLAAFSNCIFEPNPDLCIQQMLEGTGITLSEQCNSCGSVLLDCVQQECLAACIQGSEQCEACMLSAGCVSGMIQCFGLVDADADGVPAGSDCDDNNAAIHPNAAEICADGIDNNCDGVVDEGCPGTECGFFNGTQQGTCGVGFLCINGFCEPCTDNDADGFTTCDGDCDDTNASMNPATTEVCADGLDNDCDGLVDEDCGTCLDDDGDGFTTCQGDCNDNNAAVFPGHVEICADGLDNDCNGLVDEDCGPQEICDGIDNDGDGQVDEGLNLGAACGCGGVVICDGNGGTTCSVPIATEICADGIDNNCDGQVDEGCGGCTDNDADGYTTCAGDCDDNNASVNPGALEVCADGLDNDCDGLADEDCGSCLDNDGDGFTTCQGDCNDNNASVNPGAVEVCDGLDNDCDGLVNEGGVCGCAPAGTLCNDGNACTTNDTEDGACNCVGTTVSCDDGNPCTIDLCDPQTGCVHLPAPAGTPCDDGNPNTINDVCNGAGSCSGTPIQNEVCDGIDNDGDGLTDAADPSLVLVFCENQTGVCNGAMKTSNLCVGGTWLTCATSDYAIGSPVYEVTESSCDSQDNDCDGQVDEGGVCQTGATSEIEPNGTTAQADANLVQIVGPQSIAGSIAPVADLDHFKVTNSAPDVWRFETFDNSGADCTGGITTTLRFRDNAGTQLVTDATSGISTCSAITYTVPAGAYYIQVEENGNNSTVAAYRMQASVISAGSTEVEPNDIQAQANVLSGLELFAAGSHSIATDVDWYAITVPAGNSVRAELIEGNAETCESNGVDSKITLFTAAGALLVADDDDGRGFCSLIDGTGSVPLDAGAHALAGGTYYLRVESSSTANTPANIFDYKLVVTIR